MKVKRIEPGRPCGRIGARAFSTMQRSLPALVLGIALVAGSAVADEKQRPGSASSPGGQTTATAQRTTASAGPRQQGKPAPSRTQPVYQTPEGNVTGAPAVRCAATVKDFGEQWGMPELAHSYVIRNAGDQVLTLERVKPSCGCTLAGKYDKQIAPGGEGRIPIKLRTRGITGSFKKYITVNTNDPVTPALRLTLRGVMRKHVEADPARISFSHIQEDSTFTEKTTIRNNTDKPLELSFHSDPVSGPFSAELIEQEPGKVFELQVTAAPPYRPRLNRAQFVLKTNLEEQSGVKVMVTAYVPPRFDVRPDKIIVNAAPNEDMRRLVRLNNNGKKPVSILSATSNDENLRVEVVERTAGKTFEVGVVVPAGYLPPETGSAVTIETDSESKPRIEIPVKGRKPRVDTNAARKLVGRKLPAVTFHTPEGGAVSMQDLEGKVAVLDFYASWCGYSRRQIPLLDELYKRKYADNAEVRFLAVSQDTIRTDEEQARNPRARTKEQVVAAFAQLASFPTVLDTAGMGRSAFNVMRFPTLMLCGKDGRIEAVHIGLGRGFDLAATVEQEIDLLLEGKTRADFPGHVRWDQNSPGDVPGRLSPAQAGARVKPRVERAPQQIPARNTQAPSDGGS